MSKPKHTPGPWTTSGRFLVFSVAYGNVAETFTPSSLNEVESIDEAKANARLIAAAPELLAALKKLTALYATSGTGNCDVLGLSMDAIAKAEGKGE